MKILNISATILLTLMVLLLNNHQITFAQIFYSKAATFDAQSEKTAILITEVGFKQKDHDFIKISNTSTIANANLKDFSVHSDSKIYEFQTDFWIEPGKEVIFEFKNTNPPNNKNIIPISLSGLTATTEQVSLKHNDKILDAVCWENKQPTTSEIKDQEELTEQFAWQGPCIDSDEILANESIQRIKKNQDTNKKEDWQLNKLTENKQDSITPTTQPPPLITEIFPNPSGKDTNLEWIEIFNPNTQSIQLQNWHLKISTKIIQLPTLTLQPHQYYVLNKDNNITLKNTNEIIQLLNNNEVLQSINYETAPEDESYNLVDNTWHWSKLLTPNTTNIIEVEKSPNEGQTSNLIFITEVFPNPQGTDTGNEWIELLNASDEEVNLKNWIIANSSKESLLKENVVIPAESYIVFTNEDLGFSLKNSNEQISLLDFTGTIIDLVEYQKSQENSSYSLTTNTDINEQEWLWQSPTPGEENPRLTQITGVITNYDKDSGTVEIEDQKTHRNISLQVDPKNKVNELTLNQGETIKLSAIYDKNNQYKIQEIKSIEKKEISNNENTINQESQNSTNRIYGILYFIIALLTIIVITKLTEKIKTHLKILLLKLHFKHKLRKII